MQYIQRAHAVNPTSSCSKSNKVVQYIQQAHAVYSIHTSNLTARFADTLMCTNATCSFLRILAICSCGFQIHWCAPVQLCVQDTQAIRTRATCNLHIHWRAPVQLCVWNTQAIHTHSTCVCGFQKHWCAPTQLCVQDAQAIRTRASCNLHIHWHAPVQLCVQNTQAIHTHSTCSCDLLQIHWCAPVQLCVQDAREAGGWLWPSDEGIAGVNGRDVTKDDVRVSCTLTTQLFHFSIRRVYTPSCFVFLSLLFS